MSFHRYADGFRLGWFWMRWRGSFCSPERRSRAFLFEIADRGALTVAVQVWRAGFFVEAGSRRDGGGSGA